MKYPSSMSFLEAMRAAQLDFREISKLKAALTPSEMARLAEMCPPPFAYPRKLLANMDKLKVDPYLRESMGEPSDNPVRARDWVRRALDHNPNVDQEKMSSDRRRFSAWMVFDIKKSEVYVKRDTARAMTARWGCPPEDMLVQHPSSPAIVTCLDLHISQMLIKKMVSQAESVCPALEEGGAQFSMLDDIQRRTAHSIARTPFSVLQGSAGTGKTTVMAAVMTAAMTGNSDVRCLAPTHKAKNNLKLRVPDGAETSTIHSFVKRKAGALPPTFIIIDEGSMVDLELMGELAKVVLRDCSKWQICIAGDVGQLEPVGRGECFRKAVDQLKSAGKLFVLEKCYRTSFQVLFDAQSSIRNGRLPASAPGVVDIERFPNETAAWRYVKETIACEGAAVQYIAWQNKHVAIINDLVQVKVHGTCSSAFMEGDRVIYNGENKANMTTAMVGRVVAPSNKKVVVAWEDGQERTVSAADIQLAYCMTVHKAQGSEFDDVLVATFAVETMASVLDRRWIYTASTRAKNRLRISSGPGIDELVAMPIKRQGLTNLRFVT
jgi:hypothetical protein